ncbi:MAG TPA: DUF2922 domain-containing protein [Aminivibrio sp.]|jgi:hypothetical protein|uniref:DUF2922 domain-containing protein n=1 Tax=Aminivibrio sp. TaxID=1872489 RepID=UPI001A5599A3|nr:DUF2922 domain-containing protein [Aminivibrio sp.]MBL3538077.1 DUF2922 domain-containing protein [Aminivibrio sp.]NCB17125.1 DUF2922 domain-containing protein [Synergistales bacterium]HPF86344.1 DUF2922 domain-containing protein [Aminivibrio sp.]
MKFLTDLGKTFVVSLNYAKESISAAEAEAAMDAVIDNDIFDQALVSIAGAELVDRTVTEIL